MLYPSGVWNGWNWSGNRLYPPLRTWLPPVRFSVEREYFAKVEVPESGAEPGRELVAALKEGVTTADGVYKADVPAIDGRTVRVVVREAKNRMVRRYVYLPTSIILLLVKI